MGSLCSGGDVPPIVPGEDKPEPLPPGQQSKQLSQNHNAPAGQTDRNRGASNTPSEPIIFTADRKQSFAKYISDLDTEKTENFLMRFEFASQPMGTKEVQLLFHALICLYLRKMEKERKLPRDEQTKPFCEELSTHLFAAYTGRTLIRVKSLTQWIAKGELKNIDWRD